MGDVCDVITCAKFEIEIFTGYDFTGGRIFDFPIDFSMGLTTASAALTALPVIGLHKRVFAVYTKRRHKKREQRRKLQADLKTARGAALS